MQFTYWFTFAAFIFHEKQRNTGKNDTVRRKLQQVETYPDISWHPVSFWINGKFRTSERKAGIRGLQIISRLGQIRVKPSFGNGFDPNRWRIYWSQFGILLDKNQPYSQLIRCEYGWFPWSEYHNSNPKPLAPGITQRQKSISNASIMCDY